MVIELPFIPASLNELFGMHYRTRANWTRERKEEVAWLCKQIKKKVYKFPVDVNILIISGNKHKKDAANYSCKAEIDGLVLAGILPDDNSDYIRRVSFEIQYGEKDKTIIKLSTIEVL